MKTNREHTNAQRGNALVYVLIAIALFAALTFVLTKGGSDEESAGISDDKAQLYATQMISYATQAKQVIDQMIFSGAHIDDLDFTPPSDPAFNAGATSDNIHMVYHPDGGGLVPGSIAAEATKQTDADPPAGWYLGRFNNVGWTKTSAQDVILVAYQIQPAICQRINLKEGIDTIPVLSSAPKLSLIDDSSYSNGSNVDLTTETGQVCPECKNRASLCVQKDGIYAFYTVVADQ